MITLASSPSEKAYIYSMKTCSRARISSTGESEPGVLGQLIPTVGERHREFSFAKHPFGRFDVGDDHPQNTEIGGLRHAERIHVDAVFAQDAGHVVDASRLVFQKYR